MEPIIGAVVGTILTRCVDPIIGKVTSFSKEKWEEIKISTGMAFCDYLNRSQDKYSHIKTLLYRTEPKYIYDFFVAPKLEYENRKIIETSSVKKILDISNFIIIKGTGGIGKSTLMKHLFLNTIELKQLIPIFFDLKDVNNLKPDYKIEDAIFSKLQNLGVAIEKEYLSYALQSGCFVFFFDGYDEIMTDKKGYFFREFDAFCDKYLKNFFIISSRPYSDFMEFTRFTVLSTMPFNKEDALSLIRKIDFDNDIKERFLEKLESELYDKHKSFASNPLLLNIMLLTFENCAEIPEKMHIFYNQAFETLYHRHDSTKAGYKREMKSRLSDDDFKGIFSCFCYVTYAKGLFEFSDEIIKDLLKKIIQSDRFKNLKNSFCIYDYIDDLANALCIMYKDGDKYIFSHRSFQEYFTAFFLKELPDKLFEKYGLYLLKADYFRSANDSVFKLLKDMTTDRFEINILLPILIETENGIDECNKIKFYLSNFAGEIGVAKSRSKKEQDQSKTYNLSVISTMEATSFSFLFSIARLYISEDLHNGGNKALEDAECKAINYLIKMDKTKFEDRITYEEYIKEPELLDLLLNTWIGCLVKFLAGARIAILKKQKRGYDIFDLIK